MTNINLLPSAFASTPKPKPAQFSIGYIARSFACPANGHAAITAQQSPAMGRVCKASHMFYRDDQNSWRWDPIVRCRSRLLVDGMPALRASPPQAAIA